MIEYHYDYDDDDNHRDQGVVDDDDGGHERISWAEDDHSNGDDDGDDRVRHLGSKNCKECVTNVFEQNEVDERIHCRVQHLLVYE